jgi:hypothetical protein
MAARTAHGRAAGDPEEDLARWLGTRQKHHSEYVKLLNERKNELLALQIDHGPRSDIYKNAKRELDRADSQFERYHAVLRRPLNKFDMAPWAFWLLPWRWPSSRRRSTSSSSTMPSRAPTSPPM